MYYIATGTLECFRRYLNPGDADQGQGYLSIILRPATGTTTLTFCTYSAGPRPSHPASFTPKLLRVIFKKFRKTNHMESTSQSHTGFRESKSLSCKEIRHLELVLDGTGLCKVRDLVVMHLLLINLYLSTLYPCIIHLVSS